MGLKFCATSGFHLSKKNAQIAMKTARWVQTIMDVSSQETQKGAEGDLFSTVWLLNVNIGLRQITHALQQTTTDSSNSKIASASHQEKGPLCLVCEPYFMFL